MLNPDVPLEELEAAYRRWRETKGQNVDEVLDLMADDICMRSVLDPQTPNELAKVHRSRQEARRYFDVLLAEWEMIDFPQEKIVADRDTVVWIGRCSWRSRQTGKAIDTPKIDVWTFRDGKAVEFFEMYDSLGFATVAGLL